MVSYAPGQLLELRRGDKRIGNERYKAPRALSYLFIITSAMRFPQLHL